MPPLILASASPRRRDLLAQISRTPDLLVPADVDERERRGELPRQLATRLASAKAALVARLHPDAIVIGADTVVAVGRRILPKAESGEDVDRCVSLLSGRRHRVIGGICVIRGDRTWVRTVMTAVSFSRLDDQQRKAYVASGEGIGKAGGYAIQGLAAAFIDSINGSYPNVVGLCVATAGRLLDAAAKSGSRR